MQEPSEQVVSEARSNESMTGQLANLSLALATWLWAISEDVSIFDKMQTPLVYFVTGQTYWRHIGKNKHWKWAHHMIHPGIYKPCCSLEERKSVVHMAGVHDEEVRWESIDNSYRLQPQRRDFFELAS